MAFFGLTDIQFDKGAISRKGPLGVLASNPFKKNTFRYPLDLGNADKGHYLIIYIREASSTKYVSSGSGENKLSKNGLLSATKSLQDQANSVIRNAQQQALSSAKAMSSQVGGDLINKLSSSSGGLSGSVSSFLNPIIGGINNVAGGIGNLFGQSGVVFGADSQATKAVIDTNIKTITSKGLGSLIERTRMTTDSIALYMPDTLVYNYSQSFDTPSLGDELGGKLLGAGVSITEAPKGEGFGAGAKAGVNEGLKLVSEGLGKGIGGVGLGEKSASLGFTAATGLVRNPMLEMIYSSPSFRTFQFDFKFYPRDEKEALEVQKILKRLTFHQAPELADGAFLIPPSEFDIKFYYAGSQNPNIPSIGTCVLESITVNYAPAGFHAFEVPNENAASLGRTGMPVSIELQLMFKETTYLTKEDLVPDDKSVKKSTTTTYETGGYNAMGDYTS